MSELLKFVEYNAQEFGLLFLFSAYVFRIRQLMSYNAARDRQAQTGLPGTTPAKGIIYSWANIAAPWTMESTRTNYFQYVQFVVFHLGVAATLTMSFLIPYSPDSMRSVFVVRLFQLVIGAAFLVGCYRLYRRINDKYVRAISAPDDYFALMLVIAWFITAIIAAPNEPQDGEGWLLAYFLIAAFFHFYVPFSKILHYLYYPFTRYYLGKTMGHRGVFPVRRGSRPS